MNSTGKLQIGGKTYDFTSDDLQDIGEIGRGGFGTVNKMVHRKSGTVVAVKRIRSTVDEKEQKQLLMDLDVVMKSNECHYIVQFYGALFKEVGWCLFFLLLNKSKYCIRWLMQLLIKTSFVLEDKYVYI